MAQEEVKLTRSIPLAIIFGALVHTGTLIWYMAHLDASVESNKNDITEVKNWKKEREEFESKSISQSIRLTMTTESLEETCADLKNAVKELNLKIK